MEAKFGNFSELANLLSVKSRVSSDLTVLFERFSLGRLLSRMGIRKEQGYSLVQLIMALCIFRVCGETIHSAYMANFHGLVETGKNCLRFAQLVLHCCTYPQRAKHVINDNSHSYAVAKPLMPIGA